jgi:hypothetical protein|tara:strand:- start:7753 stop:7941 length:189 start_codon:yes stop_codon:yes gene_type:complete
MEKKQFLLGMLQLIDVAAKRGSWEGNELESVALLRKEVVEQLKEFAELQESVENTEEEIDNG